MQGLAIATTYKFCFKAGVDNLWHACHTWHAKQFPMARRSSNCSVSILLWFTQKHYWPWLVVLCSVFAPTHNARLL